MQFSEGSRGCVAIGAVIACLSGCQQVLGIEATRFDPSGADGGAGPDASSPGFTARVSSARVVAPLNGQSFFIVEVERTGGFAGEVTIAGGALVNGLSVATTSIAGAESSAEVLLGATAPLAIDDTVVVNLVASADGLSDQDLQITNVQVTGKPGSFDTSFGPASTGFLGINFGADDDAGFFKLSPLANGKLIANGWGTGGLGARTMATIRVTVDGIVDSTWNGGSLTRTGFNAGSGENTQAFGGGLQNDGRFISIGFSNKNANLDLALARFSVGGVVGDVEFGNFDNGKSLLDGGGIDVISDGFVRADNTIVAVGRTDGQLSLFRATSTGRLDGSFGTGGVRINPIGAASAAEAVIEDMADRLLVAGTTTAAGFDKVVVARYAPNGALDPNFGAAGLVVVGEDNVDQRAVAIALRGDGRIVVAGDTDASGNRDIELRQFLADGTPDPAFGVNGVARTEFSTNANEEVTGMLLQPDGRIVVIGHTNGAPYVARFTAAGAPDPLFSGDGVLPLDIGLNGAIHSIALHDSNRVVIGGGNSGGNPGPGTFGVVVRLWL